MTKYFAALITGLFFVVAGFGQTDHGNEMRMATVPLQATDTAIAWATSHTPPPYTLGGQGLRIEDTFSYDKVVHPLWNLSDVTTMQLTSSPCFTLHDSTTTHDTLIAATNMHIKSYRLFYIDYNPQCSQSAFYFLTHIQQCIRVPAIRDTIYHDTTYTDTSYLITTAHDSTYIIEAPCPITWFGLWGNGDNVTQKGIDALKPLGIKGWRPRFSWSLFEPVQGKFDTGYILQQLRLIAGNGLEIVPMLFVGDNSPAWIYNTVPRVKTTTGQIYPYYLDAMYQQYSKAAWAKFLEIIEPYCMGAMCAEGSTGDTGDKGGYKGDPLDKQYNISRDQWTYYRHTVWQFWHTQWIKILCVNPGNNGKDLSYIRDSAAFIVMIKQGNFTHQINMDGDSLQVLNASRTRLPDNSGALYQQQEFEGTDVADSSWKPALATDITLQNAFFGGGIINVAPSKSSYKGFSFANTYNGTDSMFFYPHIAYQGTIGTGGNWNDDICDGCILTPYKRGISIDGGNYGFRDGNGSGLFGRYYWSGAGTVHAARSCVLRIWYRDGIGTLQVGSMVVRGGGTMKEVYKDFIGTGLSVDIKTDLKLYLFEGK